MAFILRLCGRRRRRMQAFSCIADRESASGLDRQRSSIDAVRYAYVIAPRPVEVAEYCDERVCLCVCLFVCLYPRAFLRNYTLGPFMYVAYGHGSFHLRRRCDTLCTSGLWMTSYLHIMGFMEAC